MENMDFEEYSLLEDSFDGEITLFWVMIQLGFPKITKTISRACVSFFPNGEVDMRINPDFWKKLTFYEKRFVFAHELLHVLYSHGTRMSKMGDKRKANVAADIIVNESLVEVFGFDRNKVRFHNSLCWKDTIFGEKEKFTELKNFEHYYHRLLNGEGQSKNTLDNHQGDSGVPENYGDNEATSDAFIEKMMGKISELTEEDLESLKEELKNAIGNENFDNNDSGFQAGNDLSNKILSYEYKISYYQYFKSVIDKWLDSFTFEQEEEQFVFREPFLELVSEKMLIPHSYDEDQDKFEKNRLWVFVDASGSCANFIKDFLKVCGGIPAKYFDVELFSFTTEVAKIKKEDGKFTITQAYGGTSFSCIDSFIQKSCSKDSQQKPHYIFVLTDGIASVFKPKSVIPERWHFFLMPYSGNKMFKLGVPKGAKIHNFQNIK